MRVLDNNQQIESVPGFCDQVAHESGENIEACYQCGKCSASCPLVRAMDMTPNQVIRAVQLGLKDLVLDSSAVWHCAACQSCASRCPRDIDMSHVMKALARRCIREGRRPKDPAMAAFHRSFMESMERWGRAHEVEIMSLTKLRDAGQRLKDLPLGAALFGRGKLALLPHWVRGRSGKQVREIIREDQKPPVSAEEASP